MKTKLLLVALLIYAAPVQSNHTDARYCGEPERTSAGKIKRSQTVIRHFKKIYPLPDKYDRADWQIDHVIPLFSGGCDSIINLQWLPKTIKTCAGTECKDRWERVVYPKNY